MNQFLSRLVLSSGLVLAVVSPSGLKAQSWAAPSTNPPSAVVPPANVVPANTPLATVAVPVIAQSTVVVPVLTVVAVVTPIVTSVATPVVTVAAKKVLAEENSPTLSEVVVTANRLDVSVADVPNSVSVITASDIEQKQATTAFDALQGVPGLSVVETGAPGEVSSTYIRGGNDEHTLVLMDGIPLNDPISASRSYDYLDQLPLNNVEQIEVVRGPQSTLYGSNAMAGVVNIITKNGIGPLGGSASFEGGSYGTFHETASLNGGDSGGNFSLTGSRFDTAGFPSADKSFGNIVNNLDQNTNGSLKLGSNLASNLSESVLVNYVQSHTNIDGGPGAEQDDPNNFADQKQVIVGSQTKWKLLNGDWEQVLNLSFVDDNRIYTDTLSSLYPSSIENNSGYDGQSAQVTWQNNLRLAPNETFVIGFQGSEEWAYENYNSGGGAYTDNLNALAQTGSIFVESQTQLSDRLYETLGGRFDSQTQYGNHGTYQAGLAYLIPETDTKLKATYGTGYLAPTLYQLYDPTYGNNALTPETSTGFDAGFEQAFGKSFLKVGATYFHEDFNNLINFGYSNPNYPNGTYSNIGQAQSDGIESFLDFKGISHLDAKVNYTFLNARDMSTGLPLPQRPQNQGSLDLFYQLDQLELGTSIMYVGPRSDNAYINGASTTVTLAEYFLVNLKASYSLDKNIKLFARVDNLFNQYYEEVYGYGTPGTSVYGGTKVSF